jgi:deoxycytidylate deaminase
MERDRNEKMLDDPESGQQMEKTLLHADFFIRNEKSNAVQLASPIERFLHLVHGANGITPTIHEQGMYAAYAAAMSSACLSRQVGAAILSSDGELIATGCNDVPRAGGGLYRDGDNELDFRCVHMSGGICYNDRIKDELTEDIKGVFQKILADALVNKLKAPESVNAVASETADAVAKRIRGNTRLKDLIEFSRSVHAEMDALVCLARDGRGGSQDGVLYTTTYPCHNCARHIVAAGIRSVYFIEPYEKSLAARLHDDAIEHDADEDVKLSQWLDLDRDRQRKVRFLHFEGVAPSRFLDLFVADGNRKKDGKAPTWVARGASKKIPEYLEGYIDLESRVVSHLADIGLADAGGNPKTPPNAAA